MYQNLYQILRNTKSSEKTWKKLQRTRVPRMRKVSNFACNNFQPQKCNIIFKYPKVEHQPHSENDLDMPENWWMRVCQCECMCVHVYVVCIHVVQNTHSSYWLSVLHTHTLSHPNVMPNSRYRKLSRIDFCFVVLENVYDDTVDVVIVLHPSGQYIISARGSHHSMWVSGCVCV